MWRHKTLCHSTPPFFWNKLLQCTTHWSKNSKTSISKLWYLNFRSLIFNGVLWDILFEGCVFFQCKTAILWTWLSVIEIGSIWIRVNLPLTCQTSLWMKDSTATPGNSTTLRLFFSSTSQSWVTAIRLQTREIWLWRACTFVSSPLKKNQKDWLC